MPENGYRGSSSSSTDSDREQPGGTKGRKRPSGENLKLLNETSDNLEYSIKPPKIPTQSRSPQIFQAPSPVTQPVNNFDIINSSLQVLNSDDKAVLNSLLLNNTSCEARTSSDPGPLQQPSTLDMIAKSPQPSISGTSRLPLQYLSVDDLTTLNGPVIQPSTSGTSEARLQHSPVDDLTASDNSALHPQTGAGVTNLSGANLSVDVNSPQPSTSHTANPSSPEPAVSSPQPSTSRLNNWSITERPKFNNIEIRHCFNFSEAYKLDSFAKVFNHIHETLQQILDSFASTLNPKDLVQLELKADSLNPSVSSLTTAGALSVEDFFNQIELLLQSRATILADSSLMLIVQVVRAPSGGGAHRRKACTLSNDIIVKKKRKHLWISFNPDDQCCFARGLLAVLNNRFKSNPKLCEHEARQLHVRAGLSLDQKVAFSDVEKFESLLGIKIIVWYQEPNTSALLKFEASQARKPKTVFLFLHNEHYYGILNLKGFLGFDYICDFCYSGYSAPSLRCCKHQCDVCLSPDCRGGDGEAFQCPDCNRFCKSMFCFELHKTRKFDEKTCQSESICDVLKVSVKAESKPDKCLPRYCRVCRVEMKESDENHQCFIQSLPQRPVDEKYVFYDFECRQDGGTRIPNYIHCMHWSGKSWSWAGEDCVAKFFDRYRCPKYQDYTFIAHNSKGYDGCFLMKYLVESGQTPFVTAQGCKLMCFIEEDYDLRFIDSLNFLPMKLSSMPKAMGFQAQKGYFPHFFNTTENQNYIGPYPDPKYYGIQHMLSKEREEFLSWYELIKSKTFNFREEMAYYCRNNVVILRSACMKFREEVLRIGNIDPFQCMTLASLCLSMYRQNCMPNKSIGIIPSDNYKSTHKAYSTASIQWMMFLSEKEKINIRHALNHGEVKMGSFYLDGYAEIQGVPTAFEFAGCFYHGCPKCYDAQAKHPLTGTSYAESFKTLDDKLKKLREKFNLAVRVIWEHEWERMRKDDLELQDFLKRFEFPEPINPRDALNGGRTNAIKLYHKVQGDEQIHYYDFTSLYPYVNKTKTYPIGHPTFVFEEFADLKHYFGLIKITMLAPRKLYFPVLPLRICGKLMFTLCRTCAETQTSTAFAVTMIGSAV
ncbi:uncharacterized protein LOC120532230 [Polypterus senegalus]|uniref:uncharacterized protein LOC120532230 n=1 Tax=Polypterus senegalus TaxID=55291 RepID=UPI001964EC76|nr:uncharacterized protein LOC120532230 [Polypterus senegalus]